MNDTGRRRGVLGRALRRFWPVALLVALVCGAAATWAAQATRPTYSAEGQYIVPIAPPAPAVVPGETPPAPSTLPDNAYDAGVLARTYRVVLGEDDALLSAMAERTGLERGELVRDSDVVHVDGTHVLRVTFAADTEEAVREYFTALTDIVSTDSPTPNLPTGNVMPLRIPDEIDRTPGLSGTAPIIGLLAGLLLGVAAAVALERLDSRLTGSGDLRGLTRWPVFDLGGASPGTAAETVTLRVLDGRPDVRRVAVVTMPGASPRLADETARSLAAAENRLRRSGALAAGAPPVRWEAFGRLAYDGYAERAAQESEAVVVATPARARLRAVSAAFDSLQDLALPHVVAAVVPKGDRPRSDAEPDRTGAPGGAAPGAGSATATAPVSPVGGRSATPTR